MTMKMRMTSGRMSVLCGVMLLTTVRTAVASAALPVGFQPVEYVAATGAQSVDTGVVAKRSVKVVADYAFTAVSSGNVSLFGWAGNVGFLYGQNAGKVTATFTNAYVSAVATTIDSDKERHKVAFENGSLTYDGEAVAIPEAPEPFIHSLPGTIALFSRHYTWSSGETGYNWCCKARLYGLKIYDGADLVRDYAPCVRRSDLAVGLYDRVTGTFTTSRSSTALQAPPDASLELEYVESDGTAYVNTGVVAARDLKSTVDYRLTKKPSSSTTVIGWMGPSAYFFGHSASQLLYAFMASGYSATDKIAQSPDTDRHVVSIENGTCNWDGQTLWQKTAQADFVNYPDGTIALMARHVNWQNAAGKDSYSWPASMRLYSCQMSSGATAVRDYIPAKRISDGVVGLYDRVNNSFTAPVAGTLTAGPAIGTTVTERQLEIAEVTTDSEKVPVSVRTTYGMDIAAARTLYLVYGSLNAERTALVDETRVALATVPAGSDTLTAALPAEVRDFLSRHSGGFRLLLDTNPAAAAGVPFGCEPVEFVQAAGGEYIETDVAAARDLRVVVDFQLTELPTGSVAVYGWAGGCCHLFGANATQFRYGFLPADYSYVSNVDKDKFPLDTERHVVSVRNGAKDLDYKSFNSDSTTDDFDTTRKPGTIALLARHYNWNAAGDPTKAGYDWKPKAKLYSCQIYDNGTLVRDYAPCVRLSDSKAGVVNRLDGSFLPVVGSGAKVGSRLVTTEKTDIVFGPVHGLQILIK